MKRFVFVLALVSAFCLQAWSQNSAQAAGSAAGGKVLFVYEEVNNYSKPYIEWFKADLAAAGYSCDAVSAAEVKGKDISAYNAIVIHGMVMAFNTKSPIRDWLKSEPRLRGKKVFLYVTANRWFVDKLVVQLQDELKADNAQVVDAVSMATKDMNNDAKVAAVKTFVEKVR